MKSITANSELVAYCGLYCGACRKYLRGSCAGCHNNSKATWCKVRSCNIERHYSSCAECVEYPNVIECRKFNNIFSQIIGFVLRSDRPACIAQIKKYGIQQHAEKMVGLGKQSIHCSTIKMKPDRTTRNWHKKIIADAELTLGRDLTEIENHFITSRGGYVALEMIHDTIKTSNKEEIVAYLNSEAGKMPNQAL